MNDIIHIFSGTVPQAIGWALLHFVWQGAVVAGVLWVILRTGFLRDARMRYVAACGALFVGLLVAAVTVKYFTTIPASPMGGGQESREEPDSKSSAAQQVVAATTLAAPPGGASRVGSVLPWIVFVWAVGVSLLSVRLLGCWAFTQHIRTRCLKPVSEAVGVTVALLSKRLGVTRVVRVFQSLAIESPVVIGWLKPVILLPASAFTGLSAEQLETILAHELAHVRRCDYAVNLIQSVAETLLFFHPAIWWISSVIRDERENCCDDIVLAAGEDKITYAEALATLEQQRRVSATFALAASGGSLSGRIQRILAGSGPVISISRPAAAMAGALMLALIATVAVQAALLGQMKSSRKNHALANPALQYGDDLPAPLLARVTGAWNQAPLREVLAAIGNAAGQKLDAPPEVADSLVTCVFDNARVCDALTAATERQRFGWRCDDVGKVTFYLWRNRSEHLAWRHASRASNPLAKEWFDAGFSDVSYRAKQGALGDVMREFGNQMGARITLQTDLKNVRVSCDFHSVVARDALGSLLATVGLDFRVKGQAEIEIFRP